MEYISKNMEEKPILAVNELRLFVDLSCSNSEAIPSFKEFHEILISITYDAFDVQLDYAKQRINMSVLSEKIDGRIFSETDSFPKIIPINLYYDDLGQFLKQNLQGDSSNKLIGYYSFLKKTFQDSWGVLNKRSKQQLVFNTENVLIK